MCESAIVRDRIADHVVVWLTAPVDYLARKAVKKGHRPARLRRRHDRAPDPSAGGARPLVLALDPLVVDVSTASDDAAAELIVAFTRERQATT